MLKHLLHRKGWLLAIALSSIYLQPMKAQDSPWIIGLHTHSNHVFMQDAMNVVGMLVNIPIASATDGIASMDLDLARFHYLSMKDNGEEIDFKQNNPYGFTAYDMFNDLEFGAKLGWQGAESIVGAWIYGAYGMNQYKLRFLGDRDYSKHRIQSWRIGVGIRISPLKVLMEDYEWCPIIELGTTYINNFSYKGPNGSDKNQINNGMRTSYSVGVMFESGSSIMLGFDMAHYDIFNRNYTPDGGFWYPYANFKNKDYNISLRINVNIGED